MSERRFQAEAERLAQQTRVSFGVLKSSDAQDGLTQVVAAAIEAALDAAFRQGQPQWQPIATAPKDRTVIGALIRDGRVWRVHEMKHNGLSFYTSAGGTLPLMTHWMPLPAEPSHE